MAKHPDSPALSAIEAEQSLVGALFVLPSELDTIDGMLSSRDFVDENIGRLFEFMVDMHHAGQPVGDRTLLMRQLSATRFFNDLGGVAFIAKMALEVPMPGHAKRYAEEIRDASTRRMICDVLSECYQDILDTQVSPSDAMTRMESKIQTAGVHESSEVITMTDAVRSVVTRIEKARESQYAVGVQTGIIRLDSHTGGLFPGELTLIAARPSIGKSALGAQIACHTADRGLPSLFVSLEMEEWEIASRVLSRGLEIDSRKIRSGSVTDDELQQMRDAIAQYEGHPSYIWKPESATVSQIRARARMLVATKGLSLLVVDYLTLITPSTRRVERREQYGDIGKALKSLASELNIPVVALAQLSRKADEGKPRLSHLAESGNLEQDANSVWMLHRESRDATDAMLFIEKNRAGPTGEIPLHYCCEQTFFTDAVEDFV